MDRFENEGLVFEVADSGPPGAGPEGAVVLLHGFPQTFEAWCDVTPQLTAAGIRCLAPALRGFTPGACPSSRSDYRIDRLAADVLALMDAAGLHSAHLVGHDWGGGIAWMVAMSHPERVRSLTVLSTPHPKALQRAAVRSRQGLMSWYMLAMQVPVLPEALLGRGLRRSGLSSLRLPAHHERAYLDWLLRPGALRSSIAPYRALLSRLPTSLDTPVSVPVTYLWGNRDAYLGRVAAQLTGEYCTGDYRFVELDAGHWLPEKHPRIVAGEMLARIRSVDPLG